MVVPHWDHERVYNASGHTNPVPLVIHQTNYMPDTILEKTIEQAKPTKR